MFEDKEFPTTGLPLNTKWTRVGSLGSIHSNIPFRDGDVEQGYDFRDCWLIGALATIGYTTQNGGHQMVLKISDGQYKINFYKSGKPISITIDDLIPTVEGRTLFASSTNSWWIPLVEKAYAKLHGGYLNIMGGLEIYAFTDLTNWPASLTPTSKSIHTSLFIKSLLDKGALLGLSFLDAKSKTKSETENYIKAKVSLGSQDFELTFTANDNASEIAKQFCTQNDIESGKETAITNFISAHQQAKKQHDSDQGIVNTGNTLRQEVITAPPLNVKKPDVTKDVVPSHSYSILNIDIRTESMLLHNPWGTGVLQDCVVDEMCPAGTFWVRVHMIEDLFNAFHCAIPSSLLCKKTFTGVVGTTTGMSISIPSSSTPISVMILSSEPRWDGSPNTNNGDFSLLSFIIHTSDGGKLASPIAALRQVSVSDVPEGIHNLFIDNGSTSCTYSVMVFSEKVTV